jgi:riboflavin synthase
MFTGIIEEIGIMDRIERTAGFCKLYLRASKIMDDCKPGDSIAVNGVCLTVTRLFSGGFVADVMAETMRRSNLESLSAGDRVNLERSLRPTDRMGGHIVAGHVDDVGTVLALRPEGIATVMTIGVSQELVKYIAIKGSICVEGASLTVTDVSESSFQIWLIPFTKENTILGLKRMGNHVNIEVDMLARYIERLISHGGNESSGNPYTIDEGFLEKHGFI